ncbi:MAG: bifunctional 4-hydroxy-2-oxoglutarate aldolase/2-dehydro-3-deoxy-phosphogluconate aldolase [Beijerinckiaceae bacterium]|jgi:2-dehydro-3-deoxyphosphogluconate aldolase/(4S)-4-hydroxy-2-oxoglutarate aldolase|nr:bifunctional 4-hydroxy-2-oxoglutarate aldolase/2-dehydro-3-deoxy-phosphogluconate aldolase [Beijerinckiaceae bacterium]
MITSTPAQLAARDLFKLARIVPVISVDDAEDGVALARALVAGGLPIVEMTLRSPNALAVIRAMAMAVPDAVLGVGTVMNAAQASAALEAGARFLVSPGVTPALAEVAAACPVPFLPGVATVSEAMRLREMGFTTLKFFPAESSGGVAALKGFQPVLPDIAFCPTGGIDAAKAPAYLALPNVVGLGGSWIAPAGLVKARDFAAITTLARAASAILPA